MKLRTPGTKTYLFIILGAFLSSPNTYAESWDFRDNSLGIAVMREEKTDNEKFEGTKIYLEGQYVLKRVVGQTADARECCELPSRPEHFYGLLDGNLRWGFDGTGLEYTQLGITPWATMWKPERKSTKKWRATGDFLELVPTRCDRNL